MPMIVQPDEDEINGNKPQMDYLKVENNNDLSSSPYFFKKKRSNSIGIFKAKESGKRPYESSPSLWRKHYRERCYTDPCIYNKNRKNNRNINSSPLTTLIKKSFQISSSPIGLPVSTSPSIVEADNSSLDSDFDNASNEYFGSTSSVSFSNRLSPGSSMAPLQNQSEIHGQSIIGINTIGKNSNYQNIINSSNNNNNNKLDSRSLNKSATTSPVTATSTARSISPHPSKSSSSSALIPAKNEIPEKEKKRKELSSSRQKKFHRHFQQVSKDEKVLNYFSCALVSDILLQGHLYITEQHFAFYSNVFGFVTKLLIPTSSVIKISKEKTAKIIPNAVGVATVDERHVFGSFMSREAAFRLMCSVCQPLEPIENIPPKVPDIEVSEECSVEDDSSCSISGNESPPNLIDSSGSGIINTATIITNSLDDSSQAIKQRKLLSLEASQAHDVVDGIPEIAKTSYTPSNTPIKISKSPPPKFISSPYTIRLKFPTDFHIVYLGLILTIILALISGFLFYRILDIEAKTNYRSSLDLNWDTNNDEDIYAKALKWQKEMQTKSTEEAQNILSTNLEQIAKVRRSLETLSLLIHNKNIQVDDENNFHTDSLFNEEKST